MSTPDIKERKQLVRFDPTLNTGHLLQILVLALMGVGMYGAYQADKTAGRLELTQVQKDLEGERARAKEFQTEMKSDIKDMLRSMSEVKEAVAVLKAKK